MSRNMIIIYLVLACLACGIMSQEAEPEFTPGLLKDAKEAYRFAVARVQSATQTVKNFAEKSYYDHIKPIIEPHLDRANSMWNKIAVELDEYWGEYWADYTSEFTKIISKLFPMPHVGHAG